MKILQFYTSTGMRDAERVNSQDALLCPVWKFLPWQIQRDHLVGTYIESVTLTDCDDNDTDVTGYFLGDEVLITDWENGPNPTFSFATFDDAGGNILTAITSDTSNDFCYTDEFSLATGESIAVSYNLTLNSGTLPNMKLGEFTGPTDFSASTLTKAGGDIIFLTATGNTGGNVRLMMENLAGNDTSFASAFTYVRRTSLILTEFTTYDFLTYNGEPLSTTIPYGVYYLKVTDGNTDWFSEWFNVQNIQPIISTGWQSDTYDTFTTSGMNVTSAIATSAAFARTPNISIRTDEKFIFTYDLTQNSGATPFVRLAIGADVASANHTLSVGLNEVELTSTMSGSTAFFALLVSGASNFALGSVSLRRKSGEYVHLEFTNARDFNNDDKSIYYAGGWTQQAYLRSNLNLPSHETIEVGADKDGEFDTEKLVSKYVQSVVSYESRAMYDALRLLPLHSTIKILDEVGVEHTPKAGNVNIGIDWNTFDTGSLRIAWNEAGTVWTNSSDNIS